MSEVYVAQIMLFAGNFAPRGFALCNGQLLPISQNTALFSLIGTFYGGDGKSTFALPNLQGNYAIGTGQGPGLSDYVIGETGGQDSVTLLVTEIPSHNHSFVASTAMGTSFAGAGNLLATGQGGTKNATYNANIYSPNAGSASTTLAPLELSLTGNSFPHNNVQPSLAITMCIATQGVFPPRG